MPGGQRFFRSVDQAEIDDLGACFSELPGDLLDVSFQPLFQARNCGQYASSPIPKSPIFNSACDLGSSIVGGWRWLPAQILLAPNG